MPSRISVRAELQNLLDKSQALTDANRQKQLEAERRRRAEREQLARKRAKVDEDRLRKKQLEAPVVRSLRPAAMGQLFTGLGIAWISTESEEYNLQPDGFSIYYRVKVASGNGQAVVDYEFDYVNPTGTLTSGLPNQLAYSGFGTFTTFPAPKGLLVVAYVFEQIEVINRTPAPAPTDFVGPEFSRIVETRAWLVSQTAVTEVVVSNGNFDNEEAMLLESNKRDLNGTGPNDKIPGWPPGVETGGISPTPPEVDGINLVGEITPATPVEYLINDAYSVATYTSVEEFETRIDELRTSDLGGRFFPNAEPVILAASTAVPAAIPFGGIWKAATSYDFGEKAYVAAKYGQLLAPPP